MSTPSVLLIFAGHNECVSLRKDILTVQIFCLVFITHSPQTIQITLKENIYNWILETKEVQ